MTISIEELEQITLSKFSQYGFSTLTYIQECAIRVILRDKTCLLSAPTGSGKTEAAIFPILSLMSFLKVKHGISIIYVTPLRSLNNDVLRRILKYAENENLSAEIRHGDTSAKNKKKIIQNPPDILITTPESLAIILTLERFMNPLQNLRWIIIDEIHELISNERGSHLTISLERLQYVSKHKIVRIGLSASLGNIKKAGLFLSGNSNKCSILVDKNIRKYDLDIQYIDGSINDVANFIVKYIIEQKIIGSVLLFTNTRDESEYFGTILKSQKKIAVDVHHGSLSKEIREDTEHKLRHGQAGIVVCTSSLELGLDIGSVNLVVHYGSPRQVSKLIQRIGRSRHKKSISAKGLIVTNIPDDEIECLALIKRIKTNSMEEQSIHMGPLDVVAHHLVGLSLIIKKGVSVNESLNIVGTAYPFTNISSTDIESCLDLLHKNRIIYYDHEQKLFKRRIKAYKYYYENISMIPHILKFTVIDFINKNRIGSLDQKFVGDFGEKGNVFVLKGNQWKIVSIHENKLEIYVEPLYGANINIPYWVGELIPVDYKTAVEVGKIRNSIYYKNLHVSSKDLSLFFDEFNVPSDSTNIVVESNELQNHIVIHSTFGTKINTTLASLFSTILSSKLGYVVETRNDAYRILLTSSVRITKTHIENVLTSDYDVESILIASFNNTYNLNWKVWIVSKRFGLIGKEAPYDKKVARMLYDKYSKTPISSESIRVLLHDKYDVDKIKKVLQDFRKGTIHLHWFHVKQFSNLAKPILDHSSKNSSTPISIEKGILALVKERLEKTKRKIICIRCSKWERIFEVKKMPENLICPYCRSKLITSTFWYDTDLRNIISKKLNHKPLTKDENRQFERAWKISSLVNNFGKQAILVLAGHGVGADTAARILRDYVDDNEIYKQIYSAERLYVTTRGFWDN